jgi:transposase-like protein
MAKQYSAKFQVVTELLTGSKSAAQVAKVYSVHPGTVNAWKKTFLEKGPEIFAQDNLLASAGLDRLTHRAHVVVITGASFRAQRPHRTEEEVHIELSEQP